MAVSSITGGSGALPFLKEVDSTFPSVFALCESADVRAAFDFLWCEGMMVIPPSALKEPARDHWPGRGGKRQLDSLREGKVGFSVSLKPLLPAPFFFLGSFNRWSN